MLARSLIFIFGLVQFAFGMALLFWPGISLLILIWLFAAENIVSGIFIIGRSLFAKNQDNSRWLHLVQGALLLLLGLVVAFWPGLSLVTLIILICLQLLLTTASGIWQLFAAKSMFEKSLHALTGLLALVIAAYLILNTAAAIQTVLFVFGLFALGAGILTMITAFLPTQEETLLDSGEKPQVA